MPRGTLVAALLIAWSLPKSAQAQGLILAKLENRPNIGNWLLAAPARDGLPFLAYFDNINNRVRTLKCGNRGCDAGNVFAIPDSLRKFTVEDTVLGGWTGSLKIPADGRPLISHFDAMHGDLRVIRCGTPDCTSGNRVTTVDTAGESGRFNSLDLDKDGLPIIAYYDVTRGDLRVTACGDTACSKGSVSASPDTVGVVGRHVAMAVGKGGSPLIAYMDDTHGDLKYMECVDRACQGTPKIVRLDTVGMTGNFPQLVLDKDGLPVIAFEDYDFRLKLVRCGNVGCLSGNRFTLLTDEPVVGNFSLALDAEGLPVVSYSAAETDDFKVVRCRDAGCNNKTYLVLDSVSFMGLYSALYFDAGGKPFLAFTGMEALLAVWCQGPDCWSGPPVHAGGSSARRPFPPVNGSPSFLRPWRLPCGDGFRDARGRSAR